MAGPLWEPDAEAVRSSDAELQELYSAYSYCYASEANRRRLTFAIDASFAATACLLSLLSALDAHAGTQRWLTTWIPMMALAWLAARETRLVADDQTPRRNAVLIQEQFDLMFWRAGDWRNVWNPFLGGQPIQARRIKEFAHNYDGEPFEDRYWVNTTGLPPDVGALFRSMQTAAWGAKGHSRYARLNHFPAVVSVIVVLALSVIWNLESRDTAAILAAAAPFLVGRLQSARDHQDLAHRRETLENHLQQLCTPRVEVSSADVRLAQDEICRLRLEHRRIPSWLYKRYGEKDRATIDAAIEASVEAYRDDMGPTASPE